MTSAGVTREAAGIPAIAPATRSDSGELYPLSSANLGFKCAYAGKYIAENGPSRNRHARDPY